VCPKVGGFAPDHTGELTTSPESLAGFRTRTHGKGMRGGEMKGQRETKREGEGRKEGRGHALDLSPLN